MNITAKKVFTWLFIAFVILMVANRPEKMADWTNSIIDFIQQFLRGLIVIFNSLAGQK